MASTWTPEDVLEFLRAGGSVPFDEWLNLDTDTRRVFALAGDSVVMHRSRLFWDEAVGEDGGEGIADSELEALQNVAEEVIQKTHEAAEVVTPPGMGGGA